MFGFLRIPFSNETEYVCSVSVHYKYIFMMYLNRTKKKSELKCKSFQRYELQFSKWLENILLLRDDFKCFFAWRDCDSSFRRNRIFAGKVSDQPSKIYTALKTLFSPSRYRFNQHGNGGTAEKS